MGSTFGGLEIAKTGLYYCQNAMDVTAHNIANADTEGYTRQRLSSSSIDGGNSVSLIASLANFTVGGGVEIDSIEQVRNSFLDKQYRSENSLMGEWTVQSEALGYVENLFKDSSSTGIASVLGDFFESMQTLSKNVESKDIRSDFLQQAISLTETIQHYGNQLLDVQKQQDEQLAATAEEANGLIKDIVALNKSISQYELGGQNANDLRDKRNTCIDKLSKFISLSYDEQKVNGQKIFSLDAVTVNEAGQSEKISLVDNEKYNLLISYNKTDNNGEVQPFHSIAITSDSSEAVDINGSKVLEVSSFLSGSIKGYADVRDGTDTEDKGIQYFIDQLDMFASSLVKEINAVHSKGWSFPDSVNGIASHTGVNFFDEDCTKAIDISIDKEILDNVYNMSFSSTEIKGASASGDNENCLLMLGMRDKQNIDKVGNFESYVSGYLTSLGVTTAYANNMLKNQKTMLSSIETQRKSVSGVSSDEEVANMVKYEKSFSASARMISAMDEMLDILINKMGVVGR